jgi:hypothetical protein
LIIGGRKGKNETQKKDISIYYPLREAS